MLNDGCVDQETTMLALKRLRVDELGLDDVEHLFLKGMIERYSRGQSFKAGYAIGEEVTTPRRCL